MKWIREHGLPYMKKKTAIGHSQEQSKDLTKHHSKFKTVAENTKKNARQLYEVARTLIDRGKIIGRRLDVLGSPFYANFIKKTNIK